MFSKALFKQSMKANWIKWTCVTVATCVMLAIVIIALGSLAIDNIRDSLKGVFQQADQESVLKTNSVDSYELYLTSAQFENGLETMSNTLNGLPLTIIWNSVASNYETNYQEFMDANAGVEPTEDDLVQIREETVEDTYNYFNENFGEMIGSFGLSESEIKQFLTITVLAYESDKTISESTAMITAIESSYLQYVQDNAYEMYLQQEDATEETATNSSLAARALASYAIESYKTQSAQEGFVYTEDTFKEEANLYVNQMIYDQVLATFNITDSSTDEEKTNAEYYAVASKVLANTAISTYELWLDEYENNPERYPEITNDTEAKSSARIEASASIMDQIDEEVAAALSELGNMDMYGLIIGNLFYRVAGILLPMVYVIMVANGLLAGQVDSGSMAYVLSTPTKRRAVTVTQMTYLMLSLLAMFLLVTVTSVVSIWIVGGNEFTINFAEILLLNLGAFLTMFAFAGFCFMCSSIFNRSKYSMSIGGGISILMLVCTILGLFGSDVVPVAMRIGQMNFFNYLSIISLFDATSILSGGMNFLWKFGILALIGIVTFIVGVFCFEKKDLPL